MGKGDSSPVLPYQPYAKIAAWTKERRDQGFPTYTGPEIVQRLLLQFAADVLNDKESREALKEIHHVEGAFSNVVDKVRSNNP